MHSRKVELATNYCISKDYSTQNGQVLEEDKLVGFFTSCNSYNENGEMKRYKNHDRLNTYARTSGSWSDNRLGTRDLFISKLIIVAGPSKHIHLGRCPQMNVDIEI